VPGELSPSQLKDLERQLREAYPAMADPDAAGRLSPGGAQAADGAQDDAQDDAPDDGSLFGFVGRRPSALQLREAEAAVAAAEPEPEP
jgi:hypothetical protein